MTTIPFTAEARFTLDPDRTPRRESLGAGSPKTYRWQRDRTVLSLAPEFVERGRADADDEVLVTDGKVASYVDVTALVPVPPTRAARLEALRAEVAALEAEEAAEDAEVEERAAAMLNLFRTTMGRGDMEWSEATENARRGYRALARAYRPV